VAVRRRDYKAEERRRNERAREAGFSSRAAERTARRKSATWSRLHANKPIAFYHPKWSSEKVKAYYDAFVNPSTGFHAMRGPDRSDHTGALHRWFVDIMHYFSPDEWDRSPYRVEA
jgi:hypothetical protein